MTAVDDVRTSIKIPPDVRIILVFGQESAGKTTFVNNITGSNYPINDSFGDAVCTQEPTVAVTTIDGKTVAFADTTGFWSGRRHAESVFNQVSHFLEGQIGPTWDITAVLYFYALKDFTVFADVTREAEDNMKTFVDFLRKLGTDFENVGLVISHWEVYEPSEPIQRVSWLDGTRECSSMIRRGANVFHLENNLESCQQLALSLLERPPTELKLLKEPFNTSRFYIGSEAELVASLLTKKTELENMKLARLQREISPCCPRGTIGADWRVIQI
ncbi:uncharacterized protein PAC_04426 [Phialocephala subalpina]|uniref:G domain-containing protein n=1 Tax=Phialocephala subalpina TaxID=576137 RepID=A0A1L7WP58_9HELO|nr:uncharacterized protein PAC_04426 [Phialocephala subalpina]